MDRLGVLLIILVQISLSYQCGVTTHAAIAHKALYWMDSEYYDAIKNNLDIYYSASLFPDWGYNCIIASDTLHAASETAHWLPFQMETIKYIYDEYNNPHNTSAEKLIAFVFGVMSHSVADIIWHDLGITNNIRQGFIQALANSDYNYTGSRYNQDIHDLADVGGEFMTSMLFNLNYLDDRIGPNFTTIYTDIVNIYNRMGINVTYMDLLICMDELYLETELVRKISPDIIYPYYSAEAPFLTDYFLDWWMGGINSLSIWTENCWSNLTTMINKNTNNACYIYNNISSNTKSYYTPKSSSHIKKIYPKPILPKSVDCQPYHNYTVFRVHKKYSYLGTAFATCDINNDGYDEIIIGAPGNDNRGGIYILFYNNTWPQEVFVDTVNTINTNIIYIPYNGTNGSQFGASLACTDINMDGYDDIIIGLPNYNTNGSVPDSNGQIQIFYGNKIIKNKVSPDITIDTDVLYANLGTKIWRDNNNIFVGNYLTSVDNNLDQGQLIIIPKAKYPSNISCTINNCTNNLTVVGLSKNYWGWSGHKAITWNKYLIIGEPLYNGMGRIYCYLSNTLVWQIIGNNNSRFGFDFIIINDTLIVSSPHSSVKTYHGAIYFILLTELFGDYTLDSPIIKKIIYADQPYTRFGWSLLNNDDTIFVGEPNYNTDEGAVYFGNECYTYNNKKSYFGRSLLMTTYGLLVSAPIESIPMEHAGAVYLLKN